MFDDTCSLTTFKPDLSTDYWLPLFSNAASCGFPSPADSHVEEALNLNELLVKRPSSTFFVRVSGDSMAPAGIHSGDLLVVDRSLQATDGRVVIAVIDAELFVKRLRFGQNSILLVADNPDYAPIAITELMELNIWGVVTSVIHVL
jgi:DNA polymerase V